MSLLGPSARCQERTTSSTEKSDASQQAQLEFFESHIRPVLSGACYECHASDTEASGGLLLDSREGVLRGGETGPAIELGNSAQSRLIQAIEYSDPNLQMPPDGKLDRQTIAAFRSWVDAGAVDPRVTLVESAPQKLLGLPVARAQEHWAYRPISPAEFSARAVPNVSKVDQLIDARLHAEGLLPAVAATDLAQLRRLYFDLTGLPPTSAQAADYLRDRSSFRYERQVEMLLASPAFGETFARHWMDVARYAESITLRGFVLPQAWRYRDYLVQAFAEDRPYDQMVREQLAGDLLEHAQFEQRAMQVTATGFLALGNTNLEQQDKQQLEMDYIDEQLEVIGRAFLAQTIGCARCHDHKFDPIPTRDYYALAGILRSAVAMDHDNVSKWIERPLPLPVDQTQRFASFEQEIDALNREIAAHKKRLSRVASEQQKAVPVEDLPGIVIDDEQAKLVGRWNPSTHVARLVGNGYLYDDQEIPEEKTATFEPSHIPPGEYEVRLAYSAASNRATNAKVTVFSADGERVHHVNQTATPAEDGLWVSLGVYRFEPNGQCFVLLSSAGANGHVIADAVQFLPRTTAATAATKDTSGSAVGDPQSPQPASLLDGSAELSAQAERARQAQELARLEARLKKTQAEFARRPMVLTVDERSPPADIPIHIRGDVHSLGELAPRGFLTALKQPEPPSIAPDSSGRVELAEWIASPDNPLTARVYANRVWDWLMGQGIVASINNFGTTGTAPSHPELLDWLATELIQSGWSTKHLVRIIVQSDAYRRRSDVADALAVASDPDNRNYWRGHRRRLPVEALRDAMLCVSDELDLEMGGSQIQASVKADYNYQHQGTRRSIYQPVFRNSLPDLFEAFDFADASVSIGKRPRSTVATQALVLMNHPWVIARAEAAAKRFRSVSGESSEALVERVYQACFQRPSTSAELDSMVAFLDAGPTPNREQRLIQLIHTLFASIDFRYLE